MDEFDASSDLLQPFENWVAGICDFQVERIVDFLWSFG